jgi:hypothetical protein
MVLKFMGDSLQAQGHDSLVLRQQRALLAGYARIAFRIVSGNAQTKTRNIDSDVPGQGDEGIRFKLMIQWTGAMNMPSNRLASYHSASSTRFQSPSLS